jgi:hypothetical protein
MSRRWSKFHMSTCGLMYSKREEMKRTPSVVARNRHSDKLRMNSWCLGEILGMHRNGFIPDMCNDKLCSPKLERVFILFREYFQSEIRSEEESRATRIVRATDETQRLVYRQSKYWEAKTKT